MAPPAGRTSAALLAAVLFVLSAVANADAGSSAFEADNAIRSVTDRPELSGFESALFQAVGSARHALSFARFVRR